MTLHLRDIEIRETFQTLEEVNKELKRIKPIKKYRHNFSQWGDLDSREKWRELIQYEKALQMYKKELKNKNK